MTAESQREYRESAGADLITMQKLRFSKGRRIMPGGESRRSRNARGNCRAGNHHLAGGACACAPAFAMGARSALGQRLDAERALAVAAGALAGLAAKGSGERLSRHLLSWPNGVVLDRAPALQHLDGLLHGGVSPFAKDAADPVHRSSDYHHCWLFRLFPAIR